MDDAPNVDMVPAYTWSCPTCKKQNTETGTIETDPQIIAALTGHGGVLEGMTEVTHYPRVCTCVHCRQLVTAMYPSEEKDLAVVPHVHSGDDDPHMSEAVQCNICNHKWQAVFPATNDVDDLECPNCGHQSTDYADEEDG